MSRFVFAVLLLAASQVSLASFFTGQQLNDMLQAEDRLANGHASVRDANYGPTGVGYVQGIADAADTILWCAPDNVTAGQIVKIVQKYMEAHPEEWHQEAGVLVVKALAAPFPCSKK